MPTLQHRNRTPSSNAEKIQKPTRLQNSWKRKLIVSLFADNTTVYLSEFNNFNNLEELMEKWCQASGAKFNVEKTEIIPIGTEEYQNRVLETRKIN